MSPVGLRSEKDCAGDAQQQMKTTDPTSRQRRRLSSRNPYLLTKGEELISGLRWVADTKADWPTDCRSYYNFGFESDSISKGLLLTFMEAG
jgi:hypothetical protein